MGVFRSSAYTFEYIRLTVDCSNSMRISYQFDAIKQMYKVAIEHAYFMMISELMDSALKS